MTHRRHYYDLLQQVREKGDWEFWLSFSWKVLLTLLSGQPMQRAKF
jgi:hypothetical protein